MSESTAAGSAGRSVDDPDPSPSAGDPAARPAARPAPWPRVDRRAAGDRRDRPTRFWDSLRMRGERRRGRRAGEESEIYVDRYERRDVLLVLGVFVLNIFDAVCTMLWLSRGGAEGNPIMDAALQAGDAVFLFQKCFVAAIWLIILLVHKNFRIARMGLWSLFAVYAVLALYHAYLVGFVPHPVEASAGY